MLDSEEVLRHAATFFQAESFGEAEELCRHVLQSHPGHPGASHLLGLISLKRDQPESALSALQLARDAAPQAIEHWLSLGECLLSLGRFDEVTDLVRLAVKSGLGSSRLQELRVRAKRGREKSEPPVAIREEIIALFRAHRSMELESRARAALAQYPGWVPGWNALGVALSMVGKDAEAAMRRALQLAPQSAEAHNNLGVHLRERGRLQDALELLRKAARLRPQYAEAHYNIGATLCEMGQYAEAMASFDRALSIRPGYYEAMVESGIALIGMGRELEAQNILRRVLQLDPGNPKAFTNLLFGILHRGDLDAAQIFAEHRRFGEQFEKDLGEVRLGNSRDEERCLKVGFVSGDLRHHAVASFLEPVLIHLARFDSLSLHAYYNFGVVDEVTNRLKAHCASWSDIAGMADDLLLQKIRADGIDILIDLSGHTAHNCLPTFARRAAPVQASWIGYPGTTGLRSMDYYLSDRYFLPPGMFDEYFTEKIVRLPALAPFLPDRHAPPVNELPALKNGYVTFGSFNRINKISRMVVTLWARLLRALPESRMVLGGMPTDDEPTELLGWFAEEGIARERLKLYGRTAVAAYLGQHGEVDICLDTFPYNGGTTTQHALWMGVPTLTLTGKTVAGRVGAMNLGHQGLDEFITHDPDEFVRRGVEWVGRLEELAQLRQGMRERFLKSAPGRPELIAAGLEQALRIMWRRWCRGQPPESFEVDGLACGPRRDEVVEMLQRSAAHYHAGQLDEAEAVCHEILRKYPGHPDANFNLGLMALERGRPEEALPHLHAAWEAAPQEGQYWGTLGECLLELCKFEEVLALADEMINLGLDGQVARRLRLLGERGRDRAEPSSEAREIVSNLYHGAQYEELERYAKEMLREYPGWGLGWTALGMAMDSLGRNAERELRRAVEFGPEDGEAHNNLGSFLRERGRTSEGLEHLGKAAQLMLGYAAVHYNLGAAFSELGQYARALESFNRAIAIKPDSYDAMAESVLPLVFLGREQEAQEVMRRLLALDAGNAKVFANLLFAMLHCGEFDADQIFLRHRHFGEYFEKGLPAVSFANDRNADRCLQVGIVSGDFRHHVAVNFLGPLLPHLASNRSLSLHAYYNHTITDDVTDQLKGYFAHWHGVANMSDADLAQKIRTDGIDILIDLSGHTASNRLLTFARRAAPVQASWIGYPGTTGLTAMDYYLGDRHLLPPGMFDAYFTEKVVRLPALAPFLLERDAPAVNELPALKNGYVTFGSFNRINKISRSVVALWSRLLSELPDARMVLGGMPTDGEPAELLGWFAEGGIARDRLTLYGRTDVVTYLGQHGEVDICLDTFPYNGGTTTQHALCMGVPTLTLAGNTVAGRVGAMNLGHQGLDEFIAHDADEFVRRGVEWAGRLEELAQLRRGMRERFARSAPGRPELIAAGLEQALRIMWRRWCAGLPPESFEVDGAALPASVAASGPVATSEDESLLREAAEHYAGGRLDEAESLCRKVLELDPGHADANYNLGMMALERGSPEESLPYLLAAWEASPQEEQYWLTLGKCLLELCKFEEAIGLAEGALGRGLDTPAIRQIHLLAERGRDRVEPVGDASGEMVRLFSAGQYEEVERRVEKMLEESPGWIFGWKALGASRGAQGKSALRALRNAALLAPQDAEASSNLGLALLEAGFMDEALQSYRHALDIAPDDPVIYSSWLYALVLAGGEAAENLFAEHLRFAERFEAPLMAGWTGFPNEKDPERTLKLGFVSGDFLVHAVANFIEPVLRQLAGMPAIELMAYSNHVREDVATLRLQGYFARWHRVDGMSDDDLAQKIRADGIDILIDLSGHTGRNRLLTFARRAAPVQASWIGYPGTTGLRAMDYYLGDHHFLPPGMFEAYFTEKIVRLPALAPFLPVAGAPDVNELPALKNGYVTFGSFNRIGKISRMVIALWSRLLRALPDSRMVIGGMQEGGRAGDVARWFREEGVDPSRVAFLPRSTMRDYLGFHHRVDICLDTFPYNGGTTTQHALWMGVPTLTLAGNTVAGRVGAMNLGHQGLDEFIVHDADEFVRRGVEWAGRLEELAQLRRGMRERFAKSAPGRPELIAAGLEQALRIMWRRWCEGLPPESFDVDGLSGGGEAEEMLQRSAGHYHAGRLDEAEAVCHEILRKYPNHPDASYNLGLMALERGRPEEALPHLHAAWEAMPQEGQYWVTLGECLLAMGHSDEAMALAEEAIRRGLDRPELRQIRMHAAGGGMAENTTDERADG